MFKVIFTSEKDGVFYYLIDSKPQRNVSIVEDPVVPQLTEGADVLSLYRLTDHSTGYKFDMFAQEAIELVNQYSNQLYVEYMSNLPEAKLEAAKMQAASAINSKTEDYILKFVDEATQRSIGLGRRNSTKYTEAFVAKVRAFVEDCSTVCHSALQAVEKVETTKDVQTIIDNYTATLPEWN